MISWGKLLLFLSTGLLGGEPRQLETDITADLDMPEKMAARAKDFIAKGYRTIKIKVGQDPDLDIARLEAFREAIGDKPAISIDINQGWTVPQALAALKGMEKFRILFVEQPVASWDMDGLRAVRQNSPIPVMADEALFSPQDAIRLVKAEACDSFNIKLMKAAGAGNCHQREALPLFRRNRLLWAPQPSYGHPGRRQSLPEIRHPQRDIQVRLWQ
jgi:L-alanine-DL-glutamate epimerase-like enolase superfamily enzyme